MQEFGIVALAMIGGALLSALFLGVGLTVYYGRSLKILGVELVKKVDQFYAENSMVLEHQRGQLTNIAESAKSNLTSTRQEVRAALEAHGKAIEAALAEHRRDMDVIANKINANSLLEASRRGIEACMRLERVAAALWKWAQKLDEAEPAEPGVGEWTPERAEEYAPENQMATTKTIYDQTQPVTGDEPGERIPVGL